MNRKTFTAAQFKAIYSKVTRLTVDLIIKMDGGVILTLRSLPSWNNQWHLPGGTVLYKETIAQAASRVAHNELGLSVKIHRLLGYIEFPSEQKERGFGFTVSLALLCKAVSKKIKINDEASEVHIFKHLPQNTIAEQKIFLKRHWKTIQK